MDFVDDGEKAERPACSAFRDRLERRLADEETFGPTDPGADGGHERECAECQALSGFVDALAEVPSLESRELIRRVLASHEASRRRSRSRLLALSATAAIAAAAALLLVALPGSPPPKEDGARERKGDFAPVTEGPALLAGLRGVSVGLETGARAVLVGLDGERAECALERGKAAFLVRPGAASSIEIRAASARVLLVAPAGSDREGESFGATIAMVEVAGAEVSVDVVSGSAVFFLGDAGGERREISLVAGQGASTARTGLVPVDEARRLSVLELLGLLPPVKADGAVFTDEPEDAADAAGDDAAPGPERRPNRSAGAAGHPGETVSSGFEPPTSGELIAEASGLRAAGNWNAAAEAYRRVLELHPARPEATAVLVPLAELELERLRRPDLALRHFGLYVGKLPGGPLGEEALWGKCQALLSLGRANEEAAALAKFLKRYPGSVRALGAKSRLDNLGEKIE